MKKQTFLFSSNNLIHKAEFMSISIRFRYFFLSALVLLSVTTNAQTTKTWTGSVSSDWGSANNWSPAGAPGINDIVDINAAANAPEIISGTANARVVRVFSGGQLTIKLTATLNLFPNNTNGISNYGTIINDAGEINISPVGGSNNEGILNEGGTFTNKFGGEINIEGMDRYGVYNTSGSSFTNQVGGTINIGTASNPIVDNGIQNEAGCTFSNSGNLTIGRTTNKGIYSGGTFTNNSIANLTISRTTDRGIEITAGSFNNNGGTINIGAVSSPIGDDGFYSHTGSVCTNTGTINIRDITGYGLFTNGNFTNGTSGEIFIDETYYYGISHSGGTFENGGTISIGFYKAVQGGISNGANFNNLSSGTITIDRLPSIGFLNAASGAVVNEGSIKIGENGNIGTYAIKNGNLAPSSSTIYNGDCGATIHVFDGEFHDLSNGITNAGTILQESTGNSNIETNNGAILYNAGTFTVDSGNAPVSVSGSFSGKKIWTGCTDNDWATAENWFPGSVPTTSSEVVIHPLTNAPILAPATIAQAKSVSVESGTTLTNNGSLTVNDGALLISAGATAIGYGQYDLKGDFTVLGTFTPWASTVKLSGNVLQGISSTNPSINFNKLVIDKPSNATVEIQSGVVVSNELTINSGDLTVVGALSGYLTCPYLHLPNGTDLSNLDGIISTNSFLIQSGASAQGNGFYNIAGHFKVDGGTFTPGTSVVILNGSGNQTISFDPTNFYTLIINKFFGGTVHLGNGSVTVSNLLSLSKGTLNLNGSDIELIGNGTITGENATNYIYSTGAGVVKKTVDLNAPAAENPGNIGVSITSSANLGSTTIQRGHEVQTVNGEPGIVRYYDISPTNNSGLNATVRFHYLDHELNGIPESDLTPFRFNGTNWDNYPVSASDLSANWVETSGVEAFSIWTLASSAAILPVELVHFTASKMEDVVSLKWQTASETNNEGFEVEHSTDGRNWDYLGFVNGRGTSVENHEYAFTHERPSHGTNYYRLRQVDFDGSFEYSNIRSVEFEGLVGQMKIFPNPASSHSNILLPDDFEQASIQVFDVSGRVVFEQELEGDAQSTHINVSAWQSGMYLVRVLVDGRLTVSKLQVIND